MSNILLINDHFFPEIGSAANLFFELGKEFNKNGHKVRVLTTFPRTYNLNTPIKRYNCRSIFLTEKIDNLEIIRIKSLPIPKDNLILRGLEHFLISPILFCRGFFLERPDVILVYSPPLPLALLSCFLGKLKKSKVIINIQDLYPQTVIDVGMLKNHALISIFQLIEKIVYTKSDYLTVHSENNKDYVINKEAPIDNVEIVYNWVDTNFIRPLERKESFNGISLKNKFVVSYAGVLAFHQGLSVILEAAKLLETYDITFLIAGDGFDKENLVKKANSMNLKNIVIMPFQTLDKYRDLLACSDVSLVCLRRDVATPVVPGKLMSIMASGRPVIASIPPNNDTERIVKKANCGLVVEAGNPQALSDAILYIYENFKLKDDFGRNGRHYAEKHFSLEGAVQSYNSIIKKLLGIENRGGDYDPKT